MANEIAVTSWTIPIRRLGTDAAGQRMIAAKIASETEMDASPRMRADWTLLASARAAKIGEKK